MNNNAIELAKSVIGDALSNLSESGVIKVVAATAVGVFIAELFDTAREAMDKGYDVECETEFMKLKIKKSEA